MKFPAVHAAVAALLLAAAAAPGAAQVPTTDQVQQALQNPDQVSQLRQQLTASGLTPDQVRTRLTEAGYPANLLDSYLPGGTPAAGAETPGDDVLAAMKALGVGSVPVARVVPRPAPPRFAAAGSTSTRMPAAEIFGLNVFRSSTSQFEPNLSGPVDANYRLGPGDQLVLILTGDVELARTLDVTREGFVLIPQVGEVTVANLTMAELQSVLYTRLGRAYSGVKRKGATTFFSVTVSKLHSNQIFVTGDVLQPGSYRISSAGTALTALYAAGGPGNIGSLRAVSVLRGGKKIATLDVYDYLLRGDASSDPRLENGDVVFVPVHGSRVEIVGEVKRPAIYELKASETLADLVASAGGFSAAAGLQSLQIARILPPGQRTSAGRDRVLLAVTSDQLADGHVPALRVEPGDSVTVAPVTARVRDQIAVKGNVWLPGPQGFTPGMTLSQALKRAGGAKPDAFLGQVLIDRLQPDSTRIQLRATLRDTTGAIVGTDPLLSDDDQIQVFSRTSFRATRYVAIGGAVRNPGLYPYREGITMRDLILLAGGLEQRADLRSAEIARLPTVRSGGVTATTFKVQLDSTYLGDRSPDGKYIGVPGLAAPAGNTPEVVLDPYDNVLISSQPDWHLLRTVIITGEVHAPGTYVIENTGQRISDLMKRAGGTLPTANPDGAFFARNRAAVSYLPRRDSVKFKGDTVSRVGLDLPSVLRNSLSADNLLLEDGDSLDIPPLHATVEVRGAVNAPTVVAVSPGEKLTHYVLSAGGPQNHRADAGGTYVVQPNGKIESRHRVWLLFHRDPIPRAGATVIVPVRDTTSNSTATLQQISIVTGIISAVVTAIAIIKR